MEDLGWEDGTVGVGESRAWEQEEQIRAAGRPTLTTARLWSVVMARGRKPDKDQRSEFGTHITPVLLSPFFR